MAVHLDGRAPHREIAALFDEAVRCKTVEKKRQLLQRVPHLARVFTSLVGEFRASVPAFERKRGIGISAVQRDSRVWKPLEEAFIDNEWFCEETSLYDNFDVQLTLDQWINVAVDRFDDRYYTILSVLKRGGTSVIREMIDNGLDLRKFSQFPRIGQMYLWLNQLLLSMDTDERVGPEYLNYNYIECMENLGTSKGFRRANAAKAFQEACYAFGRRDFPDFPKWSSLRNEIASAEGLSRTELQDFVKHLFQLIYRTSHVCLYYELRQKKISSNVEFDMEDPTMPEALMFPLEAEVTSDLLSALYRAMRPIHGVKRDYDLFEMYQDLWDSNSATSTKRLLKWNIRMWMPLNLDMVKRVVQKNRKLREIEVEIDDSRAYNEGDECQLWKPLRDLVSCFLECAYLAKFSLHVSILPIARYELETTKIKEILEQRHVQVKLTCHSKMMLIDDSELP